MEKLGKKENDKKNIFAHKVPIQTVPMQGCGKNWDNDCGIAKKNG